MKKFQPLFSEVAKGTVGVGVNTGSEATLEESHEQESSSFGVSTLKEVASAKVSFNSTTAIVELEAESQNASQIEENVAYVANFPSLQSRANKSKKSQEMYVSNQIKFLYQMEENTVLNSKTQDNLNEEKYADNTVRISSFVEAPLVLREDANKLADAGFYYTGKDSTIRCFSCGFTEANWRKEYVPWISHSVMYGQCEFLKSWQWSLIEQALKVNQHVENKKYEQDVNLCNICCIAEKNTTFWPCGHTIACETCAKILHQKGACPICRRTITETKRIYFS